MPRGPADVIGNAVHVIRITTGEIAKTMGKAPASRCNVDEGGESGDRGSGRWWGSRFIRALFQLSKRAASEAAKFGRGGVELLGVVGAAHLERVNALDNGTTVRHPGGSIADVWPTPR